MPRGSAVDRPQEADRHLGPDKGSRRRSAGNDEARSERGSGRRWRIWYRIPDAQGTVSCVSAVFTEYIQERHETQETGSIRVQKRVQCRRCGMAWDEVRDAAPSAVESITLSSCAPGAARGRSGRSQGSIGDAVVLADVRQRPRHNRAGGIYNRLCVGQGGRDPSPKVSKKVDAGRFMSGFNHDDP
jgi:hypothetical protein